MTDIQPSSGGRSPAGTLPPEPLQKAAKSRLFPCVGYEGCNMAFTRSEHLARHMRKHTGERPFACCFCSKHFSRLDNLRQHKLTVHADDMSRSTSGSGMRNNIFNGSVYADSHMMGYHPSNIGYIRCAGPASLIECGPVIGPDHYDRAPPNHGGLWPMPTDPLNMLQSPILAQFPYGYYYQQSPSPAGISSAPYSPSYNRQAFPHVAVQLPLASSAFSSHSQRPISAPVASHLGTLHYPNYPRHEHAMPETEMRPLKPMRTLFKPKKRPKHLTLPGQDAGRHPHSHTLSSFSTRHAPASSGSVVEQSAYRTPVLGTYKEFHMPDRLLARSAPAHQTAFNAAAFPIIKDQINQVVFGGARKPDHSSVERKPEAMPHHTQQQPPQFHPNPMAVGFAARRSIDPFNAREALGLPLSPDLRNSLSKTCLSSEVALPVVADHDMSTCPALADSTQGQAPPSLPPIGLNPKDEAARTCPPTASITSKDKLPSIQSMLTTDPATAIDLGPAIDSGSGSGTSAAPITPPPPMANEAPF